MRARRAATLPAALLCALYALVVGLALVGAPRKAWAQAGVRAADLVAVDLLAEPETIQAGETFWVGVRLRMKPGWHTYWINPGDTGLPTEVTWTLPSGFRAGSLLWPAPERLPVGPLVNYGYEGEAVLLAPITAPATLPGSGPFELRAKVAYLVCERECIPGEAEIVARVGAGSARLAPDRAPLFAAARAKLPVVSPLVVKTEARGDDLVLRITAPGLRPNAIKAAYFFPFGDRALQHAAAQILSVDGDGLSLTLAPGEERPQAGAQLAGVLRLDEDLDGTISRQALQIGEPPIVPVAQATAAAAGLGAAEIVGAAALAFLGGLLLNLMPCVFPLLSVKALALVRQAGGERRTIRRHGLAYTAGVVVTFVALAILLLALRAAGSEVGWGFQLQSPLVVAGLAALLFAMGLNLSGLVAFGGGLGGVGQGLATRGGVSGSFFTGALATIVATPCTAPFMGAAVGLAVTAPAPVALAIFVALGLGMSAPFLALALVPGLIGRLPRPGAWMEVLKQALAFPLYATVAWLVFVLAQQVGPGGLFAALIGLVGVAVALWALGLSASREGPARLAFRAVAVVAALGIVVAGIKVARDGTPAAAAVNVAQADRSWLEAEPFSQARLDGLRAQGRPVFVNLTAAWCITCLVNERTALASERVRDAMAARKVVYLKGDWTRQNPEITRLLAQNGRSGVPLYLLYPPRRAPETLPQILTEAGLLDSFARL